VAATELPLQGLELDVERGEAQFRCGGRLWRFDWATQTLSEIPESKTRTHGRSWDNAPRASHRTGAETSITFRNRTTELVELFWLDEEGERRSYGRLDPEERRDQHTFAGHVWLVVGNAGEPLVVFVAEEEPMQAEIVGEAEGGAASSASAPQATKLQGISPDGVWQAVMQEHNLVLKQVRNGECVALSSDGTAGDGYSAEHIHWSPDSASLLALRIETPAARQVQLIESSPKEQLQPKLHVFDYPKPGDPIPQSKPHLFSVSERREIPVDDALFPNPWSIDAIHWSSDSTEVQFLYNERGHQVLRVVSLNAKTGQARTVVDEQSATFIDYAGKLFLHWLDDTGELIWMSERDGWNHLYLHSIRSGTVKHQITRSAWGVRGVEHVDADRRQLMIRVGGIVPDQDPYYVHYARVNFDGSGLMLLTEGDGHHSAQISPDQRYLVDTWSRVDLAPVTELRRIADGQLICELERSSLASLCATGWQAPERFRAKGRDGTTDIYGVLFRPTNFDPARVYPVIEQIYAGPQDAHVPKSFRSFFNAQTMAELGFVVVAIDGMGTSNRSKRFHDVCWKNLADAGFPDRVLWIKAAAARYPQLRLDRVGIYGGSAGGQNALGALLFHGDFYHVAVADCGCHDNRMDKLWWNELWMGWPVGPHYAEQSNVTHAHRLQGKLLLTVGELDRNVDPASTMQVVDALVKADKDFELLVLPGTGHGAGETPYASRRRMDFFVRHLLGVEPRL
jgi:dipeptidyl aminopeptidase/acylaminoacyl peptidase